MYIILIFLNGKYMFMFNIKKKKLNLDIMLKIFMKEI